MAKAGTKSVSATISLAHFNAIEEYRWSVRKNLSQVIDTAVSEFIANHNIPVPTDAPAEDAPAEKVAKGK